MTDEHDTTWPIEGMSRDCSADGQGAAVIADYLTRLPNAPGVYRMIAADGDVLYVGKAANLKKRVSGLYEAVRSAGTHRADDREHRFDGIRADGVRGRSAVA